MKLLKVKASEIKQAIDKAKLLSDDWQAEIIEIILIPKVYARWKEINLDRLYRDFTITRHDGLKPWGDREENLKRCNDKTWESFFGYTLSWTYPSSSSSALDTYWNRVSADHYGHSPSVCWDGIRRETYSAFVEELRMAFYYPDGNTVASEYLSLVNVQFVNDIKENENDNR